MAGAHPLAGGRARSARWWRCRWCCRRRCSASICWWRWGRTARSGSSPSALGLGVLPFTFCRAGGGLGVLFPALRGAADAERLRGHRRAPAGSRRHPARLAAGCLLHACRCRWPGPASSPPAILGFAHTVGEFGVVLMIGGNIPGETRVVSVQIYDHVEALEYAQAHWLAGGMLVFSFLVLLALYTLQPERDEGDDAMNAHPRPLPARLARLHAGRRSRPAGPRRHRAVRPFRLRQDHAAALHRRAGTRAAAGSSRSTAKSGRTPTRFLPTHQRPLGYVFQEASLFPHLTVRGNLDYGLKRVAGSDAPASRCDHAIELLGIGHLLDRKPDRLSGGERQRVGHRPRAGGQPAPAADGRTAGRARPGAQAGNPALSGTPARRTGNPACSTSATRRTKWRGWPTTSWSWTAGRAVAAGPLAETLARLDLPIRLGEDAGVVLDAVVAERDAQLAPGARRLRRRRACWVRDSGVRRRPPRARAHPGARRQPGACEHVDRHQHPEHSARHGRRHRPTTPTRRSPWCGCDVGGIGRCWRA